MSTNGRGANPTRLQEIDLRELDRTLDRTLDRELDELAMAEADARVRLDDAYALPAAAAVAVVDDAEALARDAELVGESDSAENLRRSAHCRASANIMQRPRLPKLCP